MGSGRAGAHNVTVAHARKRVSSFTGKSPVVVGPAKNGTLWRFALPFRRERSREAIAVPGRGRRALWRDGLMLPVDRLRIVEASRGLSRVTAWTCAAIFRPGRPTVSTEAWNNFNRPTSRVRGAQVRQKAPRKSAKTRRRERRRQGGRDKQDGPWHVRILKVPVVLSEFSALSALSRG